MAELWLSFRDALYGYLPHLVGALIVLAAGWLALRFLMNPLERLRARSHVEATTASFLLNSARTVLLLVVFTAFLQQLGVPTASLLALVGAAGLAVALSLQGSLANFASGLVVLSFRIARVGDTIEVGDVRGEVREMLPFHVVLVDESNLRITVPNTKLTGEPVRNHSALASRRAVWSLPLRDGDDVSAVREELLRRLRADARVLADPAPEVYVRDWGDKRTLAVAAWAPTSQFREVQQGMLEELARGLEAVREQRKAVGP
jgi:small conductance mechanosensitive channel